MKESSPNESNVPDLQNSLSHEVASEKVGNIAVAPVSPIKCADQELAVTSSKSIMLSKLSKLKGKLRAGESSSSVSTNNSQQEDVMQTSLRKVIQVKTDQKTPQHKISPVIPVATRDSTVGSAVQPVDKFMIKQQTNEESKTVKLKKILEQSEHSHLISQSDVTTDVSTLENHQISDHKHTVGDNSHLSHCITLDSKMHCWISEVGTVSSQSHALCVHHATTRDLERYVEECDYISTIREIAAHVQATNTMPIDMSMKQDPCPLQCKLERHGIDRNVIISDVLSMLGLEDMSRDFELKFEKSFVSRHDQSSGQSVRLNEKEDLMTQVSSIVSSTKQQSLKFLLPSLNTEHDMKLESKDKKHLRHLPTELSSPRLAVHNALTEYTIGIKILTVQVVHQIITRMKRYSWKFYHLSAIIRSIVDYQCVEYKVPLFLKDADLQFVAGDVINAVLQDSRLKLVDNGELQLTQPMLSVYDKKAMSHMDVTSPVLNQEEFYQDCIKRWSRDFSTAAITHINKTRRGYLLATVHDKIKDPLFRLPSNFTILQRDRTKIAEEVISGMKEDKRLAVDNVAFVLKSSYDRRQRMLSQRFVIYENNPSVTFYRPEDYLVYDDNYDTYKTQYEEDFAMEEFEQDNDYGSSYGAYFDCYEPALLSEYTGSCDYSETTMWSPLVWSPEHYHLYAESTSPVLEEYFPFDTSTCQGSVSEGVEFPNRYWRRSQKERLTESGQDMDVLSTTKDEHGIDSALPTVAHEDTVNADEQVMTETSTDKKVVTNISYNEVQYQEAMQSLADHFMPLVVDSITLSREPYLLSNIADTLCDPTFSNVSEVFVDVDREMIVKDVVECMLKRSKLLVLNKEGTSFTLSGCGSFENVEMN